MDPIVLTRRQNRWQAVKYASIWAAFAVLCWVLNAMESEPYSPRGLGSLAAALLFSGMTVAALCSSNVRVYLQQQFIGAWRYRLIDIVSPGDLLESQLAALRKEMSRRFEQLYPQIRIAWAQTDWAIDGDNDNLRAFLPLEIMPHDKHPVVAAEGYTVAIWRNDRWQATSLLLAGNLDEARRELARTMREVNAQGLKEGTIK